MAARRIAPTPIAWRLPLTTRGARERIPDVAATGRSCHASHPSRSRNGGGEPANSGSRTSGYQPPLRGRGNRHVPTRSPGHQDCRNLPLVSAIRLWMLRAPTLSVGAGQRGHPPSEALWGTVESLTVGRWWRSSPTFEAQGSGGGTSWSSRSRGTRRKDAAPIAPAGAWRHSRRPKPAPLICNPLSLPAPPPRTGKPFPHARLPCRRLADRARRKPSAVDRRFRRAARGAHFWYSRRGGIAARTGRSGSANGEDVRNSRHEAPSP